jgi:hypothetical protein
MINDCELVGVASTSVGGPSGTSSFVVKSMVRLGWEVPTELTATTLRMYCVAGDRVCNSVQLEFPGDE